MAKFTQVYQLVNDITQETLGEVDLLTEDLSNVVAFGNVLFSNDENTVDSFAKKLVNRIGIEIYVNRAYVGKYTGIIMRADEYGSVSSKVSSEMYEAEENSSWNLDPSKTYDRGLKVKIPKVLQKFFNEYVTFDIQQTILYEQLKQSFTSAQSLESFISMLYNEVEKSLTIKLDGLVLRMVNAMTAFTLYKSNTSGVFTGEGDNRAINLLARYKVQNPTSTLTADTCLFDKDFILYSSSQIAKYIEYITEMSTLFNIGGQERFTPSEYMHIMFLADFVTQANMYLNSSTFNDDYVKLPNSYKVSWWQGSGQNLDFDDLSAIDVKIKDVTTELSPIVEVKGTGILGVVFDRECVAVANMDRRVTTDYNADGDFWNNFHKMKAGYLADINENFIVFYVA